MRSAESLLVTSSRVARSPLGGAWATLQPNLQRVAVKRKQFVVADRDLRWTNGYPARQSIQISVENIAVYLGPGVLKMSESLNMVLKTTNDSKCLTANIFFSILGHQRILVIS